MAQSKLVVDHDHESGEVRGLLCRKCNLGIGFLREDPFIFESALVYLQTKSYIKGI